MLASVQAPALAAEAAPLGLPTPLEQSGFTRLSTSAEISSYLEELDDRVPFAHKEVLGKSALGKPLEALVFRTMPGCSGRMTILVTGSQHGAAEPAGGEALLVIARELAFGELRPLLDDVDVVLVPNANPDGRDLGRRANANGVNINIDFVLAEQPETRVLHQALQRYAPQAVLDSHESAVLKRQTLAREGYLTDFEVQFEVANTPGLPARLRALSEELLPVLLAAVVAEGLPAHRYIGEITSINQAITNGGLTLRNFRNAGGLAGAISFLVETKLDSREDSYPTYRNIKVRIGKQIISIRAFLRVMHANRRQILGLAADPAPSRIALYAGYRPDPDRQSVQIPLRRLDTRTLESLTFRDHRRVEVADSIQMPAGYIITSNVEKLRPILEVHGIRYLALSVPRAIGVVANRYAVPVNITERAKVLSSRSVAITAPAGALFIDLAQPRGKNAVLLLDPRSTSSIFRYPGYAALTSAAREVFVYATSQAVRRPLSPWRGPRRHGVRGGRSRAPLLPGCEIARCGSAASSALASR